VAAAAGCNKSGQATPVPQAQAPASVAPIKLIKPESKSLRHLIEQPAYIEAIEETPLVARIAGYVHKVHVDIGDPVKRDDVLAELSVPEMAIELQQKEALVRQAEAELKLARDSVAAADAEHKRMKSQFERFSKIGGSVLGKEDIEETRYAYEASKARHDIAQSDVGVKEARVDVAKANRDHARAMLDYSKIRAPFDGVITRRQIHTGHFLQPATGPGAMPLFVVARIDTVRVLLHVPEAEALYVSPGMAARVRVNGHEVDGKVTRSSWSFDPKARTLRTEVDLPNPGGRLRPGMYANVTLTADLANRFTLPAAAVFTHHGQPCCFQLIEGKAVCVPLKIGLREGGWVELLKQEKSSGKPGAAWEPITGKENVLLGNLAELKDGQPVSVPRP
jgi:RND family efflux transporter MFP subunit